MRIYLHMIVRCVCVFGCLFQAAFLYVYIAIRHFQYVKRVCFGIGFIAIGIDWI